MRLYKNNLDRGTILMLVYNGEKPYYLLGGRGFATSR